MNGPAPTAIAGAVEGGEGYDHFPEPELHTKKTPMFDQNIGVDFDKSGLHKPVKFKKFVPGKMFHTGEIRANLRNSSQKKFPITRFRDQQ